MHRARTLVLAATVVVLTTVGSACSSSDTSAGDETDAGPATTTTSTPGEEASTFTPITGGTDEAGNPQPPPVHATVSVVVLGDTSWAPYAGRELTGLDEEAAVAVAGRVRQIDEALNQAGVDASFELSYGNASALCEVDPDVFDELELHGHELSVHALTNGETFRAFRALDGCGIAATTVSGLPSIADPIGPAGTTVETLDDSMGLLSIQGTGQVVGRLSPMCEGLGLSAPTNNYGTGAYTAPWRSGWIDDQPCTDDPTRGIVMVDEWALLPGDTGRISPATLETARTRMVQTLGWATDLRYRSADELPAPGMLTWGLTMRLDELIAPDPEAEITTDETTSSSTEPAAPVDPRTAPLSDETLTALVEWFGGFQPAVDEGRLLWLTPSRIGETLRGA